jgi:hypothetical protein
MTPRASRSEYPARRETCPLTQHYTAPPPHDRFFTGSPTAHARVADEVAGEYRASVAARCRPPSVTTGPLPLKRRPRRVVARGDALNAGVYS